MNASLFRRAVIVGVVVFAAALVALSFWPEEDVAADGMAPGLHCGHAIAQAIALNCDTAKDHLKLCSGDDLANAQDMVETHCSAAALASAAAANTAPHLEASTPASSGSSSVDSPQQAACDAALADALAGRCEQANAAMPACKGERRAAVVAAVAQHCASK